MSTGRRLAKRSIIGTKVCAPGPDGLWYSGVIQDVKTPPSATVTSANANNAPVCETKYMVRFDFKTQDSCQQTAAGATSRAAAQRHSSAEISPAQTLRRNAMIKEFRESDLIGPGFRSILGVQLQPGQRVFLTHNGRETSADVLTHDADKDEVLVKISAIGSEEPIELKKRLEEVRLLESRRSARLADQDRDTDFARLADMGGDRRKPSHSIDVPFTTAPQPSSRKRPPSYVNECSSPEHYDEDEMNENNAAMILVNLSLSPKSPKNGDKWLGSSPGSSAASWSSGSSSPPLSDDGHHTGVITNDPTANARIRTTSVSTSDEGIVVDFKEDTPRKKRANKTRFICTWKGCTITEQSKSKIERHIRITHLGNKNSFRTPNHNAESDSHDSDSHEEEFYYTEVEDDDDDSKAPSPTSSPTLSHRDMARPPYEDPVYQRQIVKSYKQGRTAKQLQHSILHGRHTQHNLNNHSNININSSQQQHLQKNNTSCIPTSPLAHHNYTSPPPPVAIPKTNTLSSAHACDSNVLPVLPGSHQQQLPTTPQLIKHVRASPRPSQSVAPYPSPQFVHHYHNYSSPAPLSPSSSNASSLQQHSQQKNHHSCSNKYSSNSNDNSHSSSSSVIQQLSQQNVTVTTRHSSYGHHSYHSHHHHKHQSATVTIIPNYSNVRGSRGSSNHGINHQQLQADNSHKAHHLHQSELTSASNKIGASYSIHTSNSVSKQSQHQQSHCHQNYVAVQHPGKQPHMQGRRTRGENKKCRKVYGMDRRDQWCTQCKWKKACSRFID